MTFIDTNYFLKFLLQDINTQHRQAKQLFKKGAEGEITLVTSVLVFFEIYWVLESFYQKKKSELIPTLRSILSLEFINLEKRKLLRKALTIFEQTTLALEDCFNLVYASNLGVTKFMAFDKKLAKQFKKT